MWSPHVVKLAPLYNSSPEESLHVPIEFFTVEGTGIKILVVMKVIVSIMKLNCPGLRHSEVVVGWAVGGSNAIVHL